MHVCIYVTHMHRLDMHIPHIHCFTNDSGKSMRTTSNK